MGKKVLFQKFVKFCCCRWYILLHNIAISVNKECERNGVELEFVGEEIPFIGREEDMLALNLIVGQELLAWFSGRVFFVADVEESDWCVFILFDKRTLVEHPLTARSASDAPEVHINDVAGIFLLQ